MMDFVADHFEGIVAVVGGIVGAACTLGMMVYRRGVQFNILQNENRALKAQVETLEVDLKAEIKGSDDRGTAEHDKIWNVVSGVRKDVADAREDISYIRGMFDKQTKQE